MDSVREPAVAGLFYPAGSGDLKKMVEGFLAAAGPAVSPPKALVAPHAGYIYSGPVAATAYAALAEVRDTVRRVVLLGPAHRMALSGMAIPSAKRLATPLGDVAVDAEAFEIARGMPHVRVFDAPFEDEHSLEVHLPFLQVTLGEFTLVPLVIGEAGAEDICEVIETLARDAGTLVIVSSDLSHYHDYATARELDAATTRQIEALDFETIGYDQACGRNPVSGLLLYAQRHALSATTLDLRNSGDTAGPHDQVVGYGAYVFS